MKWVAVRVVFICKCGTGFEAREDLVEHLRDTARWRGRHYAPDRNEIPFRISLVRKRLK